MNKNSRLVFICQAEENHPLALEIGEMNEKEIFNFSNVDYCNYHYIK